MLGDRHGLWGLVSSVVHLFAFCWWDITAVLVEAAMVVPVDPFSGGVFEVVNASPAKDSAGVGVNYESDINPTRPG